MQLLHLSAFLLLTQAFPNYCENVFLLVLSIIWSLRHPTGFTRKYNGCCYYKAPLSKINWHSILICMPTISEKIFTLIPDSSPVCPRALVFSHIHQPSKRRLMANKLHKSNFNLGHFVCLFDSVLIWEFLRFLCKKMHSVIMRHLKKSHTSWENKLDFFLWIPPGVHI